MARICQPTIDRVETVRAQVLKLTGRICLVIRCRGQEPYDGEAEASIDLLLPETHEPYARALAAAINAVPMPETN